MGHSESQKFLFLSVAIFLPISRESLTPPAASASIVGEDGSTASKILCFDAPGKAQDHLVNDASTRTRRGTSIHIIDTPRLRSEVYDP
jgi:hypothetical protein